MHARSGVADAIPLSHLCLPVPVLIVETRGKLDIARWQADVELHKDQIAQAERALTTVADRARDISLFAMLANKPEVEFKKMLQEQYACNNAALLALKTRGPPPRPATRKPSLVLTQAAAEAPSPASVPSTAELAPVGGAPVGGAAGDAQVEAHISSHDREAAKPYWSATEDDDLYDCTSVNDNLRTRKWMRIQMQEAEAGLACLRSVTQGTSIEAEEEKYDAWLDHLKICIATTGAEAGSEIDDDSDKSDHETLPDDPALRTPRRKRASSPIVINLDGDGDKSNIQEDTGGTTSKIPEDTGGGGAKELDEADAETARPTKRSKAVNLDLGCGDGGKLGPLPKGTSVKWPECQLIVGVQYHNGVYRGRIVDREVIKQKPTVSVYFYADNITEKVHLSELTAAPDAGTDFVPAPTQTGTPTPTGTPNPTRTPTSGE